MKDTYRILNLGAGLQSTVIDLMAYRGEIPPLDASIFADTQDEPGHVYETVKWLQSLPGRCPLIVATKGSLSANITVGQALKTKDGRRFAQIPAFTTEISHEGREGRPASSCNVGILSRQCTKEFKIEVVEKAIRQQVLNLKPRQKIPKGVKIKQLFGISADERIRASRIVKRHKDKLWSIPEFPLFDFGWSREDCRAYLARHYPGREVKRSACVYCPYKSNAEWLSLKKDKEAWAKAVAIDEAIRAKEARGQQGLRQELYLHNSCLPLPLIDFEGLAAKEAARRKEDQPTLYMMCDEGVCGI